MGQVGVERDAIAGAQLPAGAIAVQHDPAGLHERALAAARLVHRGVARAGGEGARSERVQRQLGSLARQRRRQDLVAVAVALAIGVRGGPDPALLPAHDRHGAILVEAQQLREPQVEAGGDSRGDLQRRRGVTSLHLGEHRRAHATALREVAQRQVHRLPQRPHTRPDSFDVRSVPRHYVCMLSRTAVAADADSDVVLGLHPPKRHQSPRGNRLRRGLALGPVELGEQETR